MVNFSTIFVLSILSQFSRSKKQKFAKSIIAILLRMKTDITTKYHHTIKPETKSTLSSLAKHLIQCQ